tara:strand:- start:6456 stop:7004 length:549 start_codon:yes stop_codon:yes gene_type:complete
VEKHMSNDMSITRQELQDLLESDVSNTMVAVFEDYDKIYASSADYETDELITVNDTRYTRSDIMHQLLHGIPYESNEDINDLAFDILRALNYKLDNDFVIFPNSHDKSMLYVNQSSVEIAKISVQHDKILLLPPKVKSDFKIVKKIFIQLLSCILDKKSSKSDGNLKQTKVKKKPAPNFDFV